MVIKLTSQNQITLPDSALTSVDSTGYFEISVESGRIILTPVSLQKADAVREELKQRGVSEQDIDDAVAWARR
jgi:hypothetical protein